MKVLHINIVYNKGSTGKIVKDLHSYYLSKDIDSYVIYGRGRKSLNDRKRRLAPTIISRGQALLSRITGYVYGGCYLTTLKMIKQIKTIKPSIVHLHCINGYMVNIYKLLGFLKEHQYKTVLTLHAEFMYTAGCGHSYDCEQWKIGCCKDTNICPQFNKQRPKSWFFNRCNREWNLMRNGFEGFSNLTICPVSDWIANRAKQSPFMKNHKITTVMNGIDTNIFNYKKSLDKLKKKHNIANEKIILYVTPNFLSEIKGGKYVLELANKLIGKNFKFILIGKNTNQANMPSNIITLEHTDNQKQLAEYYSLADITLLTSKRETFSMICVESLCCGTPIVGFKAGAPETISIKEYCSFVKYGNIEELANSIEEFLQISFNKSMISNEAKVIYDKKNMANNYMKVYSEM